MTQPLLQSAELRAARLDGGAAAGLARLVDAVRAHPAEPAGQSGREAAVAALNGLFGDHLAAVDHPLAIAMAFRRRGVPLDLERLALRASLLRPTPRLLVMLHGVCRDDLQWERAGRDHGEGLARESAYTPIRLHYNTGLSVSTNGRLLAPLMEKLYDAWPMPIQRLVLLGHGMGGLVARSAIHHAALLQRGRLRWHARVDDLVCLGTPHLGAPLGDAEPGGDPLLDAARHAASLADLGRVRSAGIDDLRLGNILGGPPGDDGTQRSAPVPLPPGTRCFAIAAALGPAGDGASQGPPGDGMVPVASALGQHAESARRLGFTPARQAVVHGTRHVDLLSSPQVFELLRQWLV